MGSPVVSPLPGLPGILSDHCHLCPGLLGGAVGPPVLAATPLDPESDPGRHTMLHVSGQLRRKVLSQVVSEPQRLGRTRAQSGWFQGPPLPIY